jgi:transcriptional regulator with GAF, ATPase, and Fis domain
MESEIFGHARGAFSGSDRARAGLFRTAHGGTILLDEIGELSAALQAKLLRVLETGELRAVGEDHVTEVDVRIVAATNRNLDAMVRAGTFRADLLHRIAAMRIGLPPLKDRLEDVPALALHFLGQAELSIASPAMERMLRHPWPGNARELKHLVHGAAAFVRASGRKVIMVEDVARALPAGGGDESGRARILDALSAAGGNVTQAARDLGVARSGLYEAIRRFQLDPAAFRPTRR